MYRSIKYYLAMLLCFVATPGFAHIWLPVNKVSPTGLSVMVLGSGAPVAANTGGRASSGYLVFVDGQPRAMIDAGGGVFKSLSMSGANIWQMKYFLLTHMHIDHQSDVPAIVKTTYFDINRYNENNGTSVTRPYSDPIQFFGPGDWSYSASTSAFAQAHFAAQGLYLPPVPGSSGNPITAYPSTTSFIHDMFDYDTGADRYLFAFAPAITVVAPYTATSPKSFFHVTAANLDPTFWNPTVDQIQTVIQDSDGFTVRAIGTQHGPVPDMAYRVDYKGQSFIWTGDTNGLHGDVTLLARTGVDGSYDPVDLLAFDCPITPDHPANPFFQKLHPLPATIGADTQAAGVTNLLLTHLSPNTLQHMYDEVIPEIQGAGYTGNIKIARDLAVYNIGYLNNDSE